MRYQLMNDALRSAASLSNRSEPQNLAALSGEAMTNAPSAIVRVLTKAFAVVSPTNKSESSSGGMANS